MVLNPRRSLKFVASPTYVYADVGRLRLFEGIIFFFPQLYSFSGFSGVVDV